MGAIGNSIAGIGALVKGMTFTFKTMFARPVTVQYPEEKRQVYPRFRGRHVLERYDNGLERCIGCELCAGACPADCILVEGAENPPDHPFSPGERYAKRYEINMSRCIFCGLCEEACPTGAIVLRHDYELADYDIPSQIYTKEQLLVPLPVKKEATTVAVAQPNPVHSALFLIANFFCIAVYYLLLSAQFVAVVQVIVYAGAIMVLFLFVIKLLSPGREETGPDRLRALQLPAIALAIILGIGLAGVLMFNDVLGAPGNVSPQALGTVQTVGTQLFHGFLFPFEITSLLLLVALLGAIVLGKRRIE